jgi:hypothetical protein
MNSTSSETMNVLLVMAYSSTRGGRWNKISLSSAAHPCCAHQRCLSDCQGFQSSCGADMPRWCKLNMASGTISGCAAVQLLHLPWPRYRYTMPHSIPIMLRSRLSIERGRGHQKQEGVNASPAGLRICSLLSAPPHLSAPGSLQTRNLSQLCPFWQPSKLTSAEG